MRLMGTTATASMGVVISHHQAPLGMVLRELRSAEKRAKNEGGRDAFSITVIKRSGSTLQLTDKWGQALSTFNALVRYLSSEGVSRRAVFHILEWLARLEENPNAEMLEALLTYQLDRQAKGDAKKDHNIPQLAQDLAQLTGRMKPAKAGEAEKPHGKNWLENFLGVAEFMARETRAGEQH